MTDGEAVIPGAKRSNQMTPALKIEKDNFATRRAGRWRP